MHRGVRCHQPASRKPVRARVYREPTQCRGSPAVQRSERRDRLTDRRLRVTTLDQAVPAVKIFMQACTERVAQKPNIHVFGPAPAPTPAPSAASPPPQGGLIGTLDRASGSVERLTNRLRELN